VTVFEPDEESWEAASSMYCKEIEVVVVARKHIAQFIILGKIAASWC